MLDMYFESQIEYPDHENLLTGLKRGIMYNYVSSTYLNGFVNYTKPKYAILLDRYTVKGTEKVYQGRVEIESGVFSLSVRIDGEWGKLTGDKEYVLSEAKKDKYSFMHTDFSQFEDDVILISKTTEKNCYVVFWYDMDCSDCGIGMFYTEDDFETIKSNLKNTISFKHYEIPEKIFKGFHWLKG